MYIVELLERLGFSFWQVVALLVFFVLKDEIKELLNRITKFKVAGSEFEAGEHVRDPYIESLRELRAEIAESVPSESEVSHIVDKRIEVWLVAALVNIQRSTTMLWPTLRDSEVAAPFEAYIRQDSYDSIAADLAVLRSAGILSFSIQSENHTPLGMLTIRGSVSEELSNLVRKIRLD